MPKSPLLAAPLHAVEAQENVESNSNSQETNTGHHGQWLLTPTPQLSDQSSSNHHPNHYHFPMNFIENKMNQSMVNDKEIAIRYQKC